MKKINRTLHSSTRRSSLTGKLASNYALWLLASVLIIAAVEFVPHTAAQRVRTSPTSKLEISDLAKRQISELRAEKAARTPAQKKISSQLIYETKMSRGQAITASVPSLERHIEVNATGKTQVLISYRDRAAVIRGFEQMAAKYGAANGPQIISGASNPFLVEVRLDQLEEIAGMADVGAIRPRTRRIHSDQMSRPAEIPSMSVFGPRAFVNPLWSVPLSGAGTKLEIAAARSQIKQRLGAVLPSNRSGQDGDVESILATNVSQGDKTHKADVARTTRGTTGAGIKVGVLSDGVDSIASLKATGDLPSNVTVISGQAGSGDEGAAMLEIVHDLAPKAQLYFATADPTETQFAANIAALQAAGCNVIVDDILYLDESPFEDGPVAQAVNTFTAAGGLYFSSAGNEGNKSDSTSGTWEGDFSSSAAVDPAALAGANLHNFGDGGNSITASAGTAVLIWAEHFDATSGAASTDFDLYRMNTALTTIQDASTDTQDGAGGDDVPFEIVDLPATSRLLIDKFTAGTTSSSPMMNLINFGGTVTAALSTSAASRGHNSAADAFSVAATPAATGIGAGNPNGPFPSPFTTANVSERFSSDGLRRIILNPDGSEIVPGNRTSTGGIVRQKPDITAADGISAAAIDFTPFFGTSAAAPHAAAIAAMVKSGNPTLTATQIRSILSSTAIDIEAAGVDNATGAGIVMADAAVNSAPAGIVARAFPESGTATVTSENCSPQNQRLDPNAFQAVSFCITNNGPASTSLLGTLESTGGVSSITGNPQNYGVVANGATVCRPFSFRSSGSCGGKVVATVDFTDGGLNVGSTEYTMRLGTQTTAAPVTVSYTTPVVPIPDGTVAGDPGTPANATLNVAGITGRINDINVRIDGSACNTTAGSTTVGIDHTFVSDLRITLTSPSGTKVPIIYNAGSNGRNFCQTVLDDESAGPSIQAITTAPFTGSFKPAASLSAFDTEDPNGTWTLTAQDFFNVDTGSIRAFSLIITPETSSCASCSTAAGVNVGGRVLTPEGRGLSGAIVRLTDMNGTVTEAATMARGNFVFDDVASGQTYVITVESKRYSFEPQFISPTDSVSGLVFQAGSQTRPGRQVQ